MDTKLLLLAAKLANRAYQPTLKNAQKFENKRTDTTCFVLQTPACDYVCWRGTESKLDWLSNLLFIPRPVKKAWIHMGFYRAQQGVWKDVRKLLNPANSTPRPLARGCLRRNILPPVPGIPRSTPSRFRQTQYLLAP